MKEQALLVYCTVGSMDEAKKISHLLVEKRLAACCNIVPGLISCYRWQGEIHQENELLLLIKTAARKYAQLEKEIKMIHSYSVPEIIAVPVSDVSPAYLDWILENTGD